MARNTQQKIDEDDDDGEEDDDDDDDLHFFLFNGLPNLQSEMMILIDFEISWCLITVDQFIEQTIFAMMDWRVLIKLTIKRSYKRELGGRWWNQRVACGLGMGGK